MRVHSNATTNQKQRRTIQTSSKSCGMLARQLEVSKATIHRWKRRDSPQERSCRPSRIAYALSSEEEDMVLSLRSHALPLDEVVEAAQIVLPQVRRSSVHRLFVRRGVQRLQSKETPEE